jgi:HD-GYP domain-containing protein (c-di-GMP phosphodiesterase class II)
MENTNIIDIIAHTLSLMDIRLIDHGKNAALFTYNAMKNTRKYTEKEISDMCLIAILHDIGAFKTEEISRLMVFDADDVWEHSIYGYLFIKKFSPLAYLAPVVLFHHASIKFLDSVSPYYRDLAQILHIADRMEIFSRFGGVSTSEFIRYFVKSGDAAYSEALLPLFFDNDDFADRDELWQYLCRMQQSRRDISEYLKMVVLSIDFRSRHTVSHTVATAELSRLVAHIFRCSQEDITDIATGALLHDLGKAGIPVEILENPGRLSEEEMEIMKSHVLLTEQILHGRVVERIERIACRHHEKLDGSGYPNGLGAQEMAFEERLVAVTDILSALCGARSYKGVFPKEKVLSILSGMVGGGLLDASIVQKIVEHYDFLMGETDRITRPVTLNYDKLLSEYKAMLEHIDAMKASNDFQFGLYI